MRPSEEPNSVDQQLMLFDLLTAPYVQQQQQRPAPTPPIAPPSAGSPVLSIPGPPGAWEPTQDPLMQQCPDPMVEDALQLPDAPLPDTEYSPVQQQLEAFQKMLEDSIAEQQAALLSARQQAMAGHAANPLQPCSSSLPHQLSTGQALGITPQGQTLVVGPSNSQHQQQEIIPTAAAASAPAMPSGVTADLLTTIDLMLQSHVGQYAGCIPAPIPHTSTSAAAGLLPGPPAASAAWPGIPPPAAAAAGGVGTAPRATQLHPLLTQVGGWAAVAGPGLNLSSNPQQQQQQQQQQAVAGPPYLAHQQHQQAAQQSWAQPSHAWQQQQQPGGQCLPAVGPPHQLAVTSSQAPAATLLGLQASPTVPPSAAPAASCGNATLFGTPAAPPPAAPPPAAAAAGVLPRANSTSRCFSAAAAAGVGGGPAAPGSAEVVTDGGASATVSSRTVLGTSAPTAARGATDRSAAAAAGGGGGGAAGSGAVTSRQTLVTPPGRVSRQASTAASSSYVAGANKRGGWGATSSSSGSQIKREALRPGAGVAAAAAAGVVGGGATGVQLTPTEEEEAAMQGMTVMQRYHFKRKLSMQRLEQEVAAKLAQLSLLEQENKRLRWQARILENMVGDVDKQLEVMSQTDPADAGQWLALLGVNGSGQGGAARPVHRILEGSGQLDISSWQLEDFTGRWREFVAAVRPLAAAARAANTAWRAQRPTQEAQAMQAAVAAAAVSAAKAGGVGDKGGLQQLVRGYMQQQQQKEQGKGGSGGGGGGWVPQHPLSVSPHSGISIKTEPTPPPPPPAAAAAGRGAGQAPRPALFCSLGAPYHPHQLTDGRVVWGGPGTEGVPLPLLAQIEELVVTNFEWLLAMMTRAPLATYQFVTADFEGHGRVPPAAGDPFWRKVVGPLSLTQDQMLEASMCLQVATRCREQVRVERERLQQVLAAQQPDVAAGGLTAAAATCMEGREEAAAAMERNIRREAVVRNMVGLYCINVVTLLDLATISAEAFPFFCNAWAVIDAVAHELQQQQQQQAIVAAESRAAAAAAVVGGVLPRSSGGGGSGSSKRGAARSRSRGTL